MGGGKGDRDIGNMKTVGDQVLCEGRPSGRHHRRDAGRETTPPGQQSYSPAKRQRRSFVRPSVLASVKTNVDLSDAVLVDDVNGVVVVVGKLENYYTVQLSIDGCLLNFAKKNKTK